jgi:predicted PurR-regulated permease PerM
LAHHAFPAQAERSARLDLSQRGALWIVATGVIAAGLYFLREPLTQFALALILWLAIDGLAETLNKRIPLMPRLAALPIAVVFVLGLVALIGVVVVTNIQAMSADFGAYEDRLNAVLAQAYLALGIAGAIPSFADLIARLDPSSVASQIGSGLRNLASDIIFILIYLGFLFPAAALMTHKLDLIFGEGAQREAARDAFQRIRVSMERYLWVQTVVSLIITALTYATLIAVGFDNALFWSFVIFFLNYIPTIGSVVAVVVVTAVALVQFTSLPHVAVVAIGVGVWQFLIGNFVQPRMTGDSLNLSAVVVLLALAIWGAIWGIAGAFLAAPLTVMLMIVLAQFRSTRWIAILLSADGKPTPDTPNLSKSESGSN